MSLEELELQLKDATEKYSVLLDSISESLNDEPEFDIETMDPYDYLYENAPELANMLVEAFLLMNSYNEQLIEMEIEENNNNYKN
jgi:hypothetical protein